jgi:hypothetical protein
MFTKLNGLLDTVFNDIDCVTDVGIFFLFATCDVSETFSLL